MILNYIEQLPNWALFIIFPIASWAALVLLTSIFRRCSKILGLDDFDSDIIDTATQNAMSGAYVVLGFVLVLVMATANDIDSNISKEASQIEALDRLLIMEGSPSSKIARQSLHAYTKSIVGDEWGRLVSGEQDSATRLHADKLHHDVSLLQPNTPRQAALFSEITKASNEVTQYRNLRILNSQSRMPNLFWQLSYLTLLGVIAIAALRLMQPSPIRILALAIQLAMISWLFATVMILDLPYLGQIKTSPEAFEKAIQVMQSRP